LGGNISLLIEFDFTPLPLYITPTLWLRAASPFFFPHNCNVFLGNNDFFQKFAHQKQFWTLLSKHLSTLTYDTLELVSCLQKNYSKDEVLLLARYEVNAPRC
jgi:hypothetical protein